MKKITALMFVVVLAALACTACVTKKGTNNTLDRGRGAAIDAAGRMDSALGD
jgi:predicted small secreted protein